MPRSPFFNPCIQHDYKRRTTCWVDRRRSTHVDVLGLLWEINTRQILGSERRDSCGRGTRRLLVSCTSAQSLTLRRRFGQLLRQWQAVSRRCGVSGAGCCGSSKKFHPVRALRSGLRTVPHYQPLRCHSPPQLPRATEISPTRRRHGRANSPEGWGEAIS